MILFKQKDQNEQFISVFVLDGTSTVKLNEYIIDEYPVLKKVFYALDEEEIIYKIAENVVYCFPLNELKQFVEKKAKAKISHFGVDMDESNQRCY